jgi:hypothetical protein
MNVILWVQPKSGLGHSQNAWLNSTTIYSHALILGMLGAFTLHIFPKLDGTFLKGINSHSNEKDPRKSKMLGWIAIKN